MKFIYAIIALSFISVHTNMQASFREIFSHLNLEDQIYETHRFTAFNGTTETFVETNLEEILSSINSHDPDILATVKKAQTRLINHYFDLKRYLKNHPNPSNDPKETSEIDLRSLQSKIRFIEQFLQDVYKKQAQQS